MQLAQQVPDGEDLDWVTIKEETEWNEYKLKDGTTLKVKMVLAGVRRLKQYNAIGDPIYVCNAQNVVRVIDVPKSLKGPPSNKVQTTA